jgi:hypothetical protein
MHTLPLVRAFCGIDAKAQKSEIFYLCAYERAISGFAIWHSPSDPALVLREGPLKPLARGGGIDQSVEEDGTVAFGKDERFMLRNRPPCGLRERSHAELRQLPPFELSGALDQSLGRFIDPEPEPRCPQMPFALCRGRHVDLRAF